MKNWITPDGSYYIGTHVADGSIEVPERPSNYHEYINGEWVFDVSRFKSDRIEEIQAIYENDLDVLNKAWLSALISDGVGETARKEIIKQQMDDIATKLDADILSIIMEE